MPILSGSASLTRFNVPPLDEIDFDQEAFRSIQPGSEVRESIGFLPFEPEASYNIGTRRWAFRVRIDRLSPDPTAVRERLADLLRTERQSSGHDVISARKRKELRSLAEEELLRDARPQSKIIECVIDDTVLLIGSTADSVLGKITLLLRRVGIVTDFKAPWLDLGEPEAESDIIEAFGPGQSVHGSSFLKALIGDPELTIEPIDGFARLATHEARLSISGGVLNEIVRHVEGGAELLAAKLAWAEGSFRLDALTFRIAGLQLHRARGFHWSERLDERLEKINEVWELLDRKYAEIRKIQRRPSRVLNPAPAIGDSNVVPFGSS